MLNILLLQSHEGVASTVKMLLSASDYRISECLDCQDRIGVLSHLSENRPDIILFCGHSEEPLLYNDAEMLQEIRIAGCSSLILMVTEEYSKEAEEISLVYDAEWIIHLKMESDLLIKAFRRMERKLRLIRQSQADRIQRLFIDYINDERRLNVNERHLLFRDYVLEPYCQTVIIRILPPYRKHNKADEDSFVTLKGYELLVNHLRSQKKYLIARTGLDIIVCMVGDMEDLERGKKELFQFLDEIKEYNLMGSKTAAWVFMGSVVTSIIEMTQSYRAARKLIGERVIHSSICLLEIPDDTRTGGIQPIGKMDTFDVQKTLVNALETFEETTVHKVLAQLKSNIISSAQLKGVDVFEIYKTLVSTLCRELERREIPQTGLSMDYNVSIQEYSYFWNIQDVFLCLENLYMEGMELLRKKEEDDTPVPILLAKRYIRSYFNMPLTLKEISEYVGMNENYFSDYFSKLTGMTFKQFQTELRVRYAKQMLLDKNYSLEDIAEAVGYSDVKYFSRVFKQITGTAPGEYRKKYHVLKD